MRLSYSAAALLATASPVAMLSPALAEEVAVADDAGDGGGDAIIVTARRREENAQDVPIALTAVSGDTIDRTGYTSLVQIADLTPSLVIRNNNARNTFANIRGLGSNASQNDGLEIGVGFYIDDVYYGRIGASQFDLIDLERVEVLRGPQGTLFGKNTTAGAISIHTRAPTFTPEFKGEASLGENGYHQVRGTVSAPLIGDKVAFRLTLADTHNEGWLTNLFNGRDVNDYDNFSVRGQLLFVPSDALSIRLSGDYSTQQSYSRVSSVVGVFTTLANGAPNNNNFLQRAARAGYVPRYNLNDPFARQVEFNAPVQANMEGYGVSGKVDWDLGSVALTSVTAYRWWDWYPLNDQDSTPLTINVRGGTSNLQRQFSQELRLASTGERRLDYVVGLYYFWQVIHGLGQYGLGPDYAVWNNHTFANRALANYAYTGFQSDSIIEPRTKSYAAFGQLTWRATDELSITAGLRFTHEDKTGLFDQRTVSGNNLALLSAADRAAAQALRDALYPEVRYIAEEKDDSLTGQVNVAYKLAEDVLVYASYARGSKSGGISLGTLPAGISPVVEPETIDAYEIGLKSQFFNRDVTLNIAAYRIDVENYQAAITEQIGETTSSRRYISNIPGCVRRGVEVDFTFAPSRYVRFTAAAAYNDAVYIGYTNAQIAPERRNEGLVQDLSGVQLANAPKFVYSLSTDLAYPLSDEDQVYARFDYAHRSSNDTSDSNSRYTKIDPYGVLNARIGFRIEDERFDFSVWSKNLLNERYFTSLGAGNNGLITANLGDPRTFGVTARTRFDHPIFLGDKYMTVDGKIRTALTLALFAGTAFTAPLMAQQTSAAPTLVKHEGITHGPQLGNVGATSIRVWARTRAPGSFNVLYSTNPDLSDGTLSKPVKTGWEKDLTGWVQLSGLKSGTKYYYALVQDGKAADTRVDGKINSFLTLPSSAQYVDPQLNPKGVFNFAFEIGTGNNQPATGTLPPTYGRMLSELKDRIHFQIQNGDWLYEKGREQTEAEWAAQNKVAKTPAITSQAKGITGVWNNYKLYLDGSPALADFYKEVPLFVVLDDHEILNDVTGSGQPGLRQDSRNLPFQKDMRVDSVENEVERAVFRDPAIAAWRDYVGWSNPDIGNQQDPHFGTATIAAGGKVLTDKNADFTKLDLGKTNNLHVLWGFGSTGVYKIARVLDKHRIEVEPGFAVSEEVRYSIGTRLYSKFRVSNADIFLLDTRSQRTLHDKSNLASPNTSMIGADQKRWLFDELRKSDADFVFITSSVNLAVPHDNGAWYGQGSGGAGKDDGWTAHLHEREELLKLVEGLGKPVFFLTGDLHKSFVARVAPGVYDIASGPHTSNNHRIGDAGGSPPSGWYQSGNRKVNVLWSSNQYRNDSGGNSSQARGKGWPVYTVIHVNNAFNIPDPAGKDRWIAHPEPQVIFEFRDGHNGNLLFAHSVSTSDARTTSEPVSLEKVKLLGGIDAKAGK